MHLEVPFQFSPSLTYKKLGFIVLVVLLIVFWSKLVGTAVDSMLPILQVNSRILVLFPLVLGIIVLALLSPPLSVAFVFTAHYLIGQISIGQYAIGQPGISVLGIAVAVLICTLLVIRWREGVLRGYFRQRSNKTKIAILLICLAFTDGFIQSLLSPFGIWLGLDSDQSILALFTSSLRNVNDSLHYSFLSHWISFIALGMLGVVNLEELKTFFLGFSFFVIMPLFSIDLEFYKTFFYEIYVQCHSLGLGNGNVNRATLGFIAAIGAMIAWALSSSSCLKVRNTGIVWSLFCFYIVILSGSKGPVVGCLLAMVFSAFFVERAHIKRSLFVLGGVSFVSLVFYLINYSIMPCGAFLSLMNVAHSFVARGVHIGYVMEAIQRGTFSDVLLGQGYGAATRSFHQDGGVVQYHAGSHNLFIDLLLETGAVGLLLFVFALGLLIYNFFRSLGKFGKSEDVIFFKTIMGSVLIITAVKLSVHSETYAEDLPAMLIGILIGVGGMNFVNNSHPSKEEINVLPLKSS